MTQLSSLRAIAQERITVDDTPGGVRLTIANWIDPPLAYAALIPVETASIRWLSEGTAPTSTTGNIAYPGDVIRLENPSELDSFRAIRVGATSGTIQVTYLGY